MASRGAEKLNPSTIGVDVSKDHLDVHRLSDTAALRFANDKAGHKARIIWIGGEAARRVFELAGSYQRAFARVGLPRGKVNPR